jgi:ubiquinone/menaquinone biosynthesis C-methylase UbiE
VSDMSRLELWLVEALNSLIPPQDMHRQLDAAKLSDENYQERDYREAELVCPEFGPLWNVEAKRVLDVGGGLGGKSSYYAELGAQSVTVIDLRAYSMKAASSLARRKRQQCVIDSAVADAASMPFRDNSFDVVVSINVFEHVEDIYHTMAECKRVLRPGGLMFLHFPPFYSPWGAHLEGWIDFPWPHLIFSEKTLIQAAQRVEERRKRNLGYIPPAQVDWTHTEHLPELNRTTVQQFLDLIHALNLTIVRSRMLPFAWHYLANRGLLAQGALIILRGLSTLPLLREVITTKMIFVLKKT